MKFWLSVIAIALLAGTAGYIKYRLDKAVELEAENTVIKKEKQEIQNEAQALADRSRTVCDLVKRMQRAGDNAAKSEGAAVQRFSLRSCEGIR